MRFKWKCLQGYPEPNKLNWSEHSKIKFSFLIIEFTLRPRTCQAGGDVGGVAPHPPPPHLLKFVGILTKCIGKISRPNFVGKFGVFYRKKRNAEFYQYPVPQKSDFYRQWRLLKKLYKICNDSYDNNEYLAVK